MKGLTGRLQELSKRLSRFILHDVRRSPVLGLYLVIGIMAMGYVIYVAAMLYKDLSRGEASRQPVKPGVEKVRTAAVPKRLAPGKIRRTAEVAVPSPRGAAAPALPAKTAGKLGPQKTAPAPSAPSALAKVGVQAPAKIDRSNWRSFKFPGSYELFFPSGWKQSWIPAEAGIYYGIRLQPPDSAASIECYIRKRRRGEDLTQLLREKMKKAGSVQIREERKKIKKLSVIELSEVAADEHMVLTILDQKPDRYFIVSLLAPLQDYERQRSYYDAILESFHSAAAARVPPARLSAEQSSPAPEKTPEKIINKEYLLGTLVKIRMKNGARYKGVVIAEDDTSYTLESFRFGGKYSFKVMKKDIAELTY